VVPEREDLICLPDALLLAAALVWLTDCFATAVAAVAKRTRADKHQNLPARASERTRPHPFCFTVIQDAFI